jgi:hypothetical protein
VSAFRLIARQDLVPLREMAKSPACWPVDPASRITSSVSVIPGDRDQRCRYCGDSFQLGERAYSCRYRGLGLRRPALVHVRDCDYARAFTGKPRTALLTDFT